jgi:hypothetical protein
MHSMVFTGWIMIIWSVFYLPDRENYSPCNLGITLGLKDKSNPILLHFVHVDYCVTIWTLPSVYSSTNRLHNIILYYIFKNQHKFLESDYACRRYFMGFPYPTTFLQIFLHPYLSFRKSGLMTLWLSRSLSEWVLGTKRPRIYDHHSPSYLSIGCRTKKKKLFLFHFGKNLGRKFPRTGKKFGLIRAPTNKKICA